MKKKTELKGSVNYFSDDFSPTDIRRYLMKRHNIKYIK